MDKITGLLQTGNPNIVLKLRDYWNKYIRKMQVRFYEAELNKFVSCFKENSEKRLFVLLKEGGIKGFCVLSIDQDTQALFVVQASTDDVRLLKEEVKKMADRIGATAVFFYTERNNKAWERLIKAKVVGYMMEV